MKIAVALAVLLLPALVRAADQAPAETKAQKCERLDKEISKILPRGPGKLKKQKLEKERDSLGCLTPAQKKQKCAMLAADLQFLDPRFPLKQQQKRDEAKQQMAAIGCADSSK